MFAQDTPCEAQRARPTCIPANTSSASKDGSPAMTARVHNGPKFGSFAFASTLLRRSVPVPSRLMAEFVLIGLLSLVLVMAPTSSGAMITAPPALAIASVESPTLAAAPSPSDERADASGSPVSTLVPPTQRRTTGTIMFVATMGAVAVLAAFALRDMRRRR